MRHVKIEAKRRRKDGKGGVLLPITAVMVVILSITGLALLRVGLSARVQAAKTVAEIAARCAADAGFTKALYEMNKAVEGGSGQTAGSWSWLSYWDSPHCGADKITSGNVVLPNTKGSYNYVIEQIVANSQYRITSVGRSGQAQKIVSMTVRRQGLFDYALYSCGYAHPKHPKNTNYPDRPKPPKKGGRLHVKGYNLDSYSSTPAITPSGNPKLRTNSRHKHAAKFEEDSIINGDVVVGPGGRPDKVIEKKGNSDIRGNTYSAGDMPELPPVTVPASLTGLPEGDYNYQPGQPLTGNRKFSRLKIPQDGVQEIVGDCMLYVEHDMKLEPGAQLVIKENSSLTLYLGRKLDVKDDKWWEWWSDDTGTQLDSEIRGIVNETKDPKKLIIFGMDTCKKIKIEQVTDFHGAVYAPYSKVEVKDSRDVYGALVGWDIKLKKKSDQPNSTFHYDESLRVGDDSIRFVKAVWQEQ